MPRIVSNGPNRANARGREGLAPRIGAEADRLPAGPAPGGESKSRAFVGEPGLPWILLWRH
jgi:hypothetical protein